MIFLIAIAGIFYAFVTNDPDFFIGSLFLIGLRIALATRLPPRRRSDTDYWHNNQ